MNFQVLPGKEKSKVRILVLQRTKMCENIRLALVFDLIKKLNFQSFFFIQANTSLPLTQSNPVKILPKKSNQDYLRIKTSILHTKQTNPNLATQVIKFIII